MTTFEISFVDAQRQKVFHVTRPYRGQGCCCYWDLQELEICAPSGNVISSVKQDSHWLGSDLNVNNEGGETMLKMERKYHSNVHDIIFEIRSLEGEIVGSTNRGRCVQTEVGITKKTTTTKISDSCVINFPIDLDVKMKAAIIGASFLIVSFFSHILCSNVAVSFFSLFHCIGLHANYI